MSFLQTFGRALLTGVQIAEEIVGYAPIAEKLFPKEAGQIQVVSKDISEAVSVILDVEVIGQKLQLPGAQKLTAATPLIAQEILKMSPFIGKKVANEALFMQGAQKFADGLADLLNSLEDKVPTNDRSA